MSTFPVRSGNIRRYAAVVLVIGLTLAAQATAGAAPVKSPHATKSNTRSMAPKPGTWTSLGIAQGQSTAALLHVSDGNDPVVWLSPVVPSKTHYEAVELKPDGAMASKPVDVFAGNDWDGVTATPVLVSDGGRPLLLLEGTRTASPKDPYSKSCIVGDAHSGGVWKLQGWSLSANCVNPDHFGATITKSGTLAAAWPAGSTVQYHIGASQSIPASSTDQHISLGVGDANEVAEATEAKSQNIYAAWTRFFSQPASKDGLWVANLTKKSVPVKAPTTGTNTVINFPEPVALASAAGRGGIYLAYCNNSSPCNKVELWQYGAKKARAVPQSSNAARAVALSAGPSGRLWIAWWSATNGAVRVVRTNEGGTRFGPVETHPGPHACKGDGNASIRISSGLQQRLDVVMTCFDFVSPHGKSHPYATQSLVPLQIAASRGAIDHKKGGKVTYRVSDVGDAVQGASVTVDGQKGKTDKKGQITFHFGKGSKTGAFKVAASMKDYISASAKLRIT